MLHTFYQRRGAGGGGGASAMLLGMNLAGPGNSDGTIPFANLMWQSPGWELESETSVGTTVWTQKRGVLTVTAVTGTAVFRRTLYDNSDIALADYMPVGTAGSPYTVKNPNGYSVGIGAFSSAGILGFSTTTTDRTFSFSGASGVMSLHMQVTATGSYGAGLKVLIPGHDGTDYFNAQFLTFLQGLGASGGPLRLVNWLSEPRSPDTDWADRSLPTDPAIDAGAGVPWEVCFELCNRVNRDPWVNVPARATDAYVTALSNLALTNLNAGRSLWWERGNEIWNQASVFFMGTQWINYINHPRYAATVDPTAGVITHAAHGLANGETVLPFATRTTVSNGINTDTPSANSNYYYAHNGAACTVSDVTTNTFRVKQQDKGVTGAYVTFPAVRGAANYATNSVTDLIYVRVSDAGGTDVDVNYATRSVADWALADAVLGSSRVKAIMGTQAAGTSRTPTRLGVTGASRFNYVAGAPYYKGFWQHCVVDVASGQFTPKIWTTDFTSSSYATSTVHYGVYAQGSTPFNYEVENGTGTGYVASSHKTWAATLGSRVNGPVTITNATPAVVTMDTTPPASGGTVSFATTGALPTGLTVGTSYFIVNPSGNTFQVSATSGGAAIATTGAGSGTHTGTVSYGLSSYIPGAAATGMVNGTTYTHCFVITDHTGYKWRINADIAASASASTANAPDNYANQCLRHLMYMLDTNMPNIALHQSAIAASSNPAGKYIDYEFAASNQDEQSYAPAAAMTWMRAATADATNKAIIKLNLTKQAANGVYEVAYYMDVSAVGISWSTAHSYSDTTDPRYVGLAEFAGTVPIYTQITQLDIQATGITAAPSLPYVITALPADGTTYSVINATPSADQYDVSGGNLRLLSNLGIDYGTTVARTVRLRKSDGKTDMFFNVKVSTGPAPWWEPTATFALKMTTQSDTATLTPDVGAALPITSGTGGTFSGGYLNSGSTEYSSVAMTSPIPASTPFLIAFAGNIGTAPTAQRLWQFGAGGVLINITSWAANTVIWEWYAGTATPAQDVLTANVSYDTTNAVHWMYHDGAGNCSFGHNQITDTTAVMPASGVLMPIPANVYLEGTNDVKGSCEVVPLAGMSLTAAKAIVQKIQNIHGI